MASIEVDPAVLGNESEEGYSSSGYDTSTESLSSSINEYVFENGRRYHAYFGQDKNLHPTDEIEQDRLDIQHEGLLLMLDGELHKAPLKSPHRILDLGTGTGIWAIDVANKYPSAEVLGTDLSPIQPTWVPPNCKFEVDDAEQKFLYKPNSFDFVHVRNLGQGIAHWSKLIDEIFKVTKPGGYVQLGELGSIIFSDDNTLADNNPIKVFFEALAEAMGKIGRPGPTSESLKTLLEEAGFVDIEVHNYKQPIGPWPKDKKLKQVGAMMLLNVQTAFHAYGLAAFTRILGLGHDEADKICTEALRASRNKNYHSYNMFHVVLGRKPE